MRKFGNQLAIVQNLSDIKLIKAKQFAIKTTVCVRSGTKLLSDVWVLLHDNNELGE